MRQQNRDLFGILSWCNDIARIWLIVISAVIAFALAWLSLAQYRGYNLRSFDLGNMSQAIWSVTQGQPLIFTTEGIVWSRLSLHVELIYFLLTPIYALWPTPETLLVLQAVLYVLGTWPLYHFAVRHLRHSGMALLLTAVYLLYPVGQTAVLFHFHADTIALPFLLFAINALDQKAWRAYTVWLLLALACKFYVAMPVAVMGVIIWWQGERKAGLGTFTLAVSWGVVAFFVIRPYFAVPETAATGASISYYLSYYFGQIFQFDSTFLVRLLNGLIVFGPVLLIALRSPLWLLPASAITLPVMLSNGPGPSYDYRYHHYALAVPFLMIAAVYGAKKLRIQAESCHPPQKWRSYIGLTAVITLILNALLVNTPLNPFFYQREPGITLGMGNSSYGHTSRDDYKDQWLTNLIPPQAAVIASDQLGFRLINRNELYRIRMNFKTFSDMLPQADYVVLDALNDFVLGNSEGISEGGVALDHPALAQLLTDPQFRLLRMDDGLLLFGRRGDALSWDIEVVTDSHSSSVNHLAVFENLVALRGVEIKPVANGRYQLTFMWQALQSMSPLPPLMAVSRLDGLPHSRFVHLPTLAVKPVHTWTTGQTIYETFTIELSAETPPGRYPLLTGWYDTTYYLAHQTNANSQIGAETQIGWLEIKAP